jgi:flagellar M-ring protein FliF
VLVDNVAGAPAAAGKPAASRALNDAELKRIETLVQQAIGFDQQRGDVVSVVNAPFAPAAIDAPDTSLPLWQDPRNMNIARLALGGLAVLGLIIFVLRPAFKSMLSPRGANGTALVMAGAGGGVGQVMPTVTAEMVDDDEVPVKLSPAYSPKPALPPAPGFDQKLQSARDVAGADPKRVAQVVREMVASDG